MTEEIKRLNDVWITAWFGKDAAPVNANYRLELTAALREIVRSRSAV